MKVGVWARLIVGAALLSLAGCGNFWHKPSGGGGGCTTNCNTTASGNFYVLNSETKQIGAFSITTSATLQTISGSPYDLSVSPLSIAISPVHSFLYIGTALGIYVYSINASTGALTQAGSGPISQDFASTMQVDPSGTWLVDAGPGGTDSVVVSAIQLDPSTGLQASNKEEQVGLSGNTVEQMTISPDGNNVFVALGSSGTVVIPFVATNSDPFSSSTTKIPVIGTGGAALSVAVDPLNRLFYIGETVAVSGNNTGGLRVFDYTTLGNTLSELQHSPFATQGLAPKAIQPESTGSFVYVANGLGTSNGNVAAFSLTTTGGALSLTAGATAAAGVTPSGIAEDNTNTYILVTAAGGNKDLTAFTFNSTSGTLTSALTASTGTDPVLAVGIAAAP